MTAMTEAQLMGEELWATLKASRNVIVEEQSVKGFTMTRKRQYAKVRYWYSSTWVSPLCLHGSLVLTSHDWS